MYMLKMFGPCFKRVCEGCLVLVLILHVQLLSKFFIDSDFCHY